MPTSPLGASRCKCPERTTAATSPDTSRAKSILLAFGVTTAMMLSAATEAASDAQGIAHLAGGVSAEERASIAAREAQYNVKLVFTLTEGNYLADVAVAIKDAAGSVVLATHALGPILLARLPRGEYTVDATHDGRTQTRKLTAGDRLRTEYLRWPSDPKKDFPGPRDSE